MLCLQMVCPVCVTTALIANAPTIAAAFSGAAAVKIAWQKRGVTCKKDSTFFSSATVAPEKHLRVRRPVPIKININDGDLWSPGTKGKVSNYFMGALILCDALSFLLTSD